MLSALLAKQTFHQVRIWFPHQKIVSKLFQNRIENQDFEPIYRTQVTTYFERILRQVTADNKADNITFFFSSNPNSQMSLWNNYKEYVNAIIQQNDAVEYEMEIGGRNCDIKFNFGGDTRNMHISFKKASAEVTV